MEASRAAHAAGLAPRVVHFGEGVLVLDFIEGRPLAAEDFRARLPDLAALIARAHAAMGRRLRGEAGAFWAFHVIRDYLDALGQAGAALQGGRLPGLVGALEAAQIPLPLVFGHHDLLPANVLDDGRRLWLIDWEYAGFGTAMFDLANLADNGGFDAGEDQRLLELYFGRPPETTTLRAFAAMKVASALREALWAMISQIHLAAPGADYAAYAKDCFAKFETAQAAYINHYGS
jgi:thiamine kinase-like enzyme